MRVYRIFFNQDGSIRGVTQSLSLK